MIGLQTNCTWNKWDVNENSSVKINIIQCKYKAEVDQKYLQAYKDLEYLLHSLKEIQQTISHKQKL